MKKSVLLLLFTLILQGVLPAQERMRVSVGSYSIEIPLGWLAQYTGSPYVFFLFSPAEENDTFQENANLTVEALPRAYTVAAYMKEGLEALKQVYEGFQLLESKDNYHVVSGGINGVQVVQLQYFYVNGREAYILTFSATPESFAAYRGVFSQVAGTFRYN